MEKLRGIPLTQWLNHTMEVIIDRPLGSTHPQNGLYYPVNYGYVPGMMGGDGEELDAYVLGVDQPLQRFVGVLIAVVIREDDDEDKLVLAPEGIQFSKEEISALVNFQEQFFSSRVLTGAD